MPYFHPRPPRGILSIATTVHSPTHGENPSWRAAPLGIWSRAIWSPERRCSGDWCCWANRQCSKVADRDGRWGNWDFLSIVGAIACSSSSKISPRCFSMFICSARVMGCFVYSSEGDGLLCIFHIKRNVPPWSAGLATRSVVGFVGAKVLLWFGIAKLFWRKRIKAA